MASLTGLASPYLSTSVSSSSCQGSRGCGSPRLSPPSPHPGPRPRAKSLTHSFQLLTEDRDHLSVLVHPGGAARNKPPGCCRGACSPVFQPFLRCLPPSGGRDTPLGFFQPCSPCPAPFPGSFRSCLAWPWHSDKSQHRSSPRGWRYAQNLTCSLTESSQQDPPGSCILTPSF